MSLDKKVEKYISDLFVEVSPSQQLFDLKQELKANMHERINDYKDRGMNDEEAFKKAKVSMGDLSGLVEDMREQGKNQSKQQIYTSMTNRVSIGGIVLGSAFILFGILISLSTFFMSVEPVAAVGPGIFAVIGGTILTYSVLTVETEKKYGMNKVRAGLYAIAVALILFAIFTSLTSGLATGELFIAISSFTIFFVLGFAILLGLLLTNKVDRRK